MAGVAPTLGSEINSVFISAMRSGAAASAQDQGRTVSYLAWFAEPLLGVPVYAQGGFVANCSAGGNIRIQTLGAAPGGGRVTLANTPVTFSSCAHTSSGRNVVATGSLSANGNWTASEPTSPVRLSGDLSVNEIGTVAIDGSTGASFVGAVGGISVGVADTPPPPNPAPPVCPTPVPTPQCPAPSPTPAPTPAPAPINVTGTWRSANGAEALVLTQSGTAISGSATLGALPVTVVTNSITGSVSGSNVTFTWTLVTRTSADTVTITSTTTMTFSMVAAGSSAMSGTATAVITTVCAGSQFCPPSTTTTNTSSGTFTKQ